MEKRVFIVWNESKTEGFATTDEQLAYKTRKSSDTNCYHEDGTPSKVAQTFCDVFSSNNCTIDVITQWEPVEVSWEDYKSWKDRQ